MSIYEILKDDHDRIKELLQELMAISQDNAEDRHRIIQDIRDELIPHSRAEEAVFYNALRAIDAGKGEAFHGYQEHLMAETLLRTLQIMDTIGADWRKTCEKLRNALEHHIQEEETEIFAIAKANLTHQEAEMIGQAFETLKPQVQQEGFMKNTMDMLTNMMPPRFTSKLKDQNISPRLS